MDVDGEGEEVTATETPPAEAPRRRRKISFALVGQASAVVGLVAACLGILFTLVPGLKPGSGDHGSPREPELTVQGVARRVPLQEYLTAERLPRGSTSAAALRHLGAMATVRYTVGGYNGRQLQLDAALADADTGATACVHRYTLPPASGTTQTMRVWLGFPGGAAAARATYNLHVSLFPPDGKPPPLRAHDLEGIPGPGTDAGPIGSVAAFC